MSLKKRLRYVAKVLPGAAWRGLRRGVSGHVHLILALADHFEPAIDPTSGSKRAPRPEQLRRLEFWTQEYPKAAARYRDHDGQPFVHTYFFPAEQYDREQVEMLAEHCRSGWGEIEIQVSRVTGSFTTM